MVTRWANQGIGIGHVTVQDGLESGHRSPGSEPRDVESPVPKGAGAVTGITSPGLFALPDQPVEVLPGVAAQDVLVRDRTRLQTNEVLRQA